MAEEALIRSTRAAGAETVGRIAGAGENSIARVFDGAANSVKVDANELAVPFHQLARDEDVLDVAGVHQGYDRPRHVVEREDVDAVGLPA